MSPDGAVVVVAALGAPHGIRGFSHLRSFTQPPENVLDYAPWLLCRDGRWCAADAEVRRYRGGLVARVAGVADRDAAALLSGVEIGVRADSLPEAEEGEYYWRDLVGLAVRNPAGEPLGRVARMLATGAHDVMVLDDRGRERLVPFVADIVRSVRLGSLAVPGEVVADWERDWD